MIGPRKVDRPLVLYGYGNLGHLAEEIFNELKIPIDGIFSNYAPLDLMGNKDRLLVICVATEPYSSIIANPIFKGWTDIVPVWDVIEAYPEVGLGNGWFVGELTQEDQEGIVSITPRWKDGHSRYHYAAFVHWHINHEEDKFWEWCPLKPISSLPSTLADIRRRQVVNVLYERLPKDRGDIVIHNEGCELRTLEINIGLFRRYRPKITVACYHSRDGLWKIPKFLMDNLEDYDFTFRLHAYMGQAAYIYCTPKERG